MVRRAAWCQDRWGHCNPGALCRREPHSRVALESHSRPPPPPIQRILRRPAHSHSSAGVDWDGFGNLPQRGSKSQGEQELTQSSSTSLDYTQRKITDWLSEIEHLHMWNSASAIHTQSHQGMLLSHKYLRTKYAQFFLKLVLTIPLFHLSSWFPILVPLSLPLNSHSTNKDQKASAQYITNVYFVECVVFFC